MIKSSMDTLLTAVSCLNTITFETTLHKKKIENIINEKGIGPILKEESGQGQEPQVAAVSGSISRPLHCCGNATEVGGGRE